MAPDAEDTVRHHYGSADISARIDQALGKAGKDLNSLSRADLTPFDEFHGGGIASTRDLARFAGVTSGMRVADIGCGVGGPARTLAAEFGCRVTGVDLTPEFVHAAAMLTARVGMQDQCDFLHGSATALPLHDDSFDCVRSQNMMMNVEHKATLFAEAARVLKPGGIFAFEAVLEGNGEPVHLPAFWASRQDINFLVPRATLERLLDAAGLQQVALVETTAEVLEHGRRRKAAIARHESDKLTIQVIVPDDVETKMANAMRNNLEGRTIPVKGFYRKGG